MRRAKTRRFVPSNSEPLEVYWCLFYPNYRISEASTGLGFGREKVPAIVFDRELIFVVATGLCEGFATFNMGTQ